MQDLENNLFIKLTKQYLDTTIEFIRKSIVTDDSDAIFLTHLLYSYYGVTGCEDIQDIMVYTNLLATYDIAATLTPLEKSAEFNDFLEALNMVHEYKWADGVNDKMCAVLIAFIKATS